VCTYCSDTRATSSDHNDLAASIKVWPLRLQILRYSPMDFLGQLERQGVSQSWVGTVERHVVKVQCL
jgi:hypothetical protein